jgi:hypothetical protein
MNQPVLPILLEKYKYNPLSVIEPGGRDIGNARDFRKKIITVHFVVCARLLLGYFAVYLSE